MGEAMLDDNITTPKVKINELEFHTLRAIFTLTLTMCLCCSLRPCENPIPSKRPFVSRMGYYNNYF